ncbi:MAG: small multi-drug export protein [Clostridia bacterium]|nr:small multi-drug export protein [Clostridia bacterium]
MIEAIKDFFVTHFSPLVAVFFTSMIPIIECRGAIPLGVALLGTSSDAILKVMTVAIIGNMLPIPFILWLIRPLIAWLKKKKILKGFTEWIEKRAEKGKERVKKYEKLGLFLFVAIPIPGTGAWTGALVAAMLQMRIKDALPLIGVGVLVASLIMTMLSFGVGWIINIF